MEKERKIKVLSVITLVVAILGLTIAFAALSQTLTINGTASVDAASWNVHFESLDGADEVSAELSRTPNEQSNFSGSALTFGNDKTTASVNMTVFGRPGDTIEYNFKIVNNGTVDAIISDVTKNTPEFGTNTEGDSPETGSVVGTPDEEDIEFFNNYFIYKLTYTETGTEVSKDDVINAGEEKSVTLTIGIDEAAPELPGSTNNETDPPLFVGNLGVKIIYVQKLKTN